MRKFFLLYSFLAFATLLLPAQSLDPAITEPELSPEEQEFMEYALADSIKGATGTIEFTDDHFNLDVPRGFIFLDYEQTRHLLVDYWGNPEDVLEGTLGALVSANDSIYLNVAIAYTISYNNAGYVRDDDADSINYDELLKEIQKAMKENSKATGRDLECIGWAWQPSYDKAAHTLMWARLLRFGDQETINFDMRILGKDGFVTITAIADPEDKAAVQAAQSTMVHSVKYDSGYAYTDFNPERDHVAEWTLGGLIAGKVLAKVGFWGLLAKFSKIILVAILAFFAGIWKWIKSRTRRKDESQDNTSETTENQNPDASDPTDGSEA